MSDLIITKEVLLGKAIASNNIDITKIYIYGERDSMNRVWMVTPVTLVI